MKILLTGITSIQTNSRSTRSKRDYMSFPYVLHKMLVALGHTVDFKVYEPSVDKLNRYNIVICGLAPTSSRTSVYAYNAFLAMQHEHVLFYINDWQVKAAFSPRIAADPFNEFVVGCNKLEPSKVERKIIQKKVNWFFERKHDVLCQMFNWGEHDLVKEGTRIRNVLAIDPTPCMTLPKRIYHGKKQRAWVCATLKDYSDNDKPMLRDLTWDVIHFNKNNYMSESTLIAAHYPRNWGVIALPYYHRGCGWFRGRYLHAIQSNCVLLAHRKEVEPMAYENNPYVFDTDALENIRDPHIRQLADAQLETFYRYVDRKDNTLDKLNDYLIGGGRK